MLTGLAIIITGILYILLPHFVMPLEYIKGGRGAMLLSECSIWYHPELYIGILTIIAGISSLKYKKPVIIAALAGFLGIIQAIVLRPVSFYTQSKDPIIILGQTESIRSHLYTREIILILSIVVIILSILHFVLARKAAKPLRITTLTLAYSNLKRRRFRSLALILSLTIVIGAFFSDIFLSKSIESTLEIGAGRLGADLMVVPENEKKAAQAVLLSGGPTIFYLKRDILDGLKALPQIEKISPQLYVQPFSYKVCCVAESILIIAYDPETDFTVGPWIKYALKGNQGPFDIVVGKLVKFYPGQYIDLFGRKLKVAASLDPTGLGYFDNSAFIPMKGARKLLSDLKKREKFHKIPTRQEVLDLSFANLFPAGKENKIKIKDIDPNGISAIFIKAKNNVDVKALSKKIIKKFNGIGVINVRESTLSVKRHLSSMLSAFLLPVIILLAMGTIILSVVFSMIVTERLREIGLFRAMGARKSDIFRLVITEAIILSGIGGIFGILFGGSLILIFKNSIMASLDLLYIWPSPGVIFNVIVITSLVSIMVGIVSGFYPSLRAATMEPYYAVRAGEK